MTAGEAASLAWLAAFAWLPALGLLAAYPRRAWPAWLCAGAAAAGALLAGWPAAHRLELLICAGWAVAGSALAGWACRSRAARLGDELARLEQRRRQAEDTMKRLQDRRARGVQTEREQRQTLALYGMIKSLAEALSWDDMRPKLESAVDQFLGAGSFSLFAASPEDKSGLRLISTRRLEGSPAASWPTLERCLQEQGLELSAPRALSRPEAAVAVPVLDGAEVIGYFYAKPPSGQAAEDFLPLAQAFVQEVAFAFRRVKLFQEVESLSRIDGLTGVARRGEFDERLTREITRAQTFKTTFGLMLLDIDYFKRLNDRYGHPFGDQVLRRIGEILSASVYDTDFVARYGGEEFVILLPRAEPAGALRKAETIRRAIEVEKFSCGFETVPVTASIGVAHFPRDAASGQELLGRADGAMYAAKSRGRNAVVDSQALRES